MSDVSTQNSLALIDLSYHRGDSPGSRCSGPREDDKFGRRHTRPTLEGDASLSAARCQSACGQLTLWTPGFAAPERFCL